MADKDAGSKAAEASAKALKDFQKAQDEVNKLTAIPKSSTGETENLGNAPSSPPAEPTVNEPGYVVFQNPEPKEEAKPA